MAWHEASWFPGGLRDTEEISLMVEWLRAWSQFWSLVVKIWMPCRRRVSAISAVEHEKVGSCLDASNIRYSEMKMSWQEKREASSGFISPPHSGLVCGLKEWTSGNESRKEKTSNFESGDASGEGGGHSGLHFSREGNRRLSGVASQLLVWCHLSRGQKSRSTDWIWLILRGFHSPL